MSDTVSTRDEQGIRFITLNRPDKLNAMNKALEDELSAELIRADQDPNVAVIVITGAGRAFSAGADLSGSGDTPPSNRDIAESVTHGIEFYKLLVSLDTPMIAAVHGYALGGGCNLAISCDLVVAAEDAIFGYPEVKLGMAAAGVAPPLVHQIGRKAAFELLVLCDNIDAKTAKKMGMINRIVPADQVLETATKLAQQLADFDHNSLRFTKQIIRRSAELPIDQALNLGRDVGMAAHLYK